MGMILAGEATPAQTAGFLLVGRAVGDSAPELAAYTRAMRSLVREIPVPPGPPVVSVAGGFDGKLRTLNVGAAASLVSAAAGARVLLPGCENTPPKSGRTVFDALRTLGVPAPQTLEDAEGMLAQHGLAATSVDHYLPELHALLGLRWEMARRTVLSVAEKLVSPVPGSRFVAGITHRKPFLETIPEALIELGVERALVFQAVEGSDEAPLDGASALVLVNDGAAEEFSISPESLGLSRATRGHVPWRSPEDEARRVRGALYGEDGPVRDLILYNAALRLWVAGEASETLESHLVRAREAVGSGAALALPGDLRRQRAGVRA